MKELPEALRGVSPGNRLWYVQEKHLFSGYHIIHCSKPTRRSKLLWWIGRISVICYGVHCISTFHDICWMPSIHWEKIKSAFAYCSSSEELNSDFLSLIIRKFDRSRSRQSRTWDSWKESVVADSFVQHLRTNTENSEKCFQFRSK